MRFALALVAFLALPLSVHAQTISRITLSTTVNISQINTFTAAVNTGQLPAGTYAVWAEGHVEGPYGDSIECQIRTTTGSGGFTGTADNRDMPSMGETALTLVPVPVSPTTATTYTLYCLNQTSTSAIIEPVDTYIAWAGPF